MIGGGADSAETNPTEAGRRARKETEPERRAIGHTEADQRPTTVHGKPASSLRAAHTGACQISTRRNATSAINTTNAAISSHGHKGTGSRAVRSSGSPTIEASIP